MASGKAQERQASFSRHHGRSAGQQRGGLANSLGRHPLNTGLKRESSRTKQPRHAEDEVDRGSDSDGNEWVLGEVGSQDDSELDSDYAMGDSDAERFEGFAFHGTASKNGQKSRTKPIASLAPGADMETIKDLKLAKPDHANDDGWEGFEDDDLGSDAQEKTAVLDASETYMENMTDSKVILPHPSDADPDESSSANETDSELSVSDEELERDDPRKIQALKSLIDAIRPSGEEPPTKRQRLARASESGHPSDFGISDTRKLTVEDLLPSVTDAHMRKSLRLMSSGKDSKIPGKRSGIPGKLNPPLAKRQQDRLDRAAAYVKSKETLERWIDTIKHNRQAEHLSFPLTASVSAGTRHGGQHHRAEITPLNELEVTIQNILRESGLEDRNGRSEEQSIKRLEELQAKEMPLQEVQARRAQLRMARELLFREEIRSKRLKKIKSKAYRRIHRKERQKTDLDTRSALIAGGLINSEDEQELMDRRRAEERMGARHRDSKWAKQVKANGRQKWDEDARTGIEVMASTEEALKRRIEGRSIKGTEDSSVVSSSEFDSDGESINDDNTNIGKGSLLRRLDVLGGRSGVQGQGEPGPSKLSTMAFMQRADAARTKENDAMVQQLKRELAGEASLSEDETFLPSRRKYQPKTEDGPKAPPAGNYKMNDFEERPGLEDKSGQDIAALGYESQPFTDASGGLLLQKAKETHSLLGKRRIAATNKRNTGALSAPGEVGSAVGNSFAARQCLEQSGDRASKSGLADSSRENAVLSIPESITTSGPRESNPQSDLSKWSSLTMETPGAISDDEEFEIDRTQSANIQLSQDELRKRAFAADEADQSFKAEKEEAIKDEDDKVIDSTLPGWGHWVGDGVSKKAQDRHKGKYLTKVKGVKEAKRADAKLDNVIISEKRVKKVSYVFLSW